MSEDEPTLTLDGLNLNRDSQDEQLHAYAPVSAIDELRAAAVSVDQPKDKVPEPFVPLSTAIEKVERLLAGYFTDEEFQNLCHRFDKTQKAIFCDGCEDYQKRLFGSSPITELKQQVATLTAENEQLKQLIEQGTLANLAEVLTSDDLDSDAVEADNKQMLEIARLTAALEKARIALEEYAREEPWSNADGQHGPYLEWPKIGPEIARAALAALSEPPGEQK